MAYMVRLGIWGPGSPFRDFNDFLAAVEKRGVGAMEIVAMDMKLRGMYIARQLSFQVGEICSLHLSSYPASPPWFILLDCQRCIAFKLSKLVPSPHVSRLSCSFQSLAIYSSCL